VEAKLTDPLLPRSRLAAINDDIVALNPDKYLLVFEPRAEGSLATATCTAEIFVAACQSAARVLHAMHAKRLLHCDLSLSNILTLSNGRVILNDFGSVQEAGTLRLDKDFACTPMYATHRLGQPPGLDDVEELMYDGLDDVEALIYVLVAFARRTPFALASVPHRYLPWDKGAIPQKLLRIVKRDAVTVAPSNGDSLLAFLKADYESCSDSASQAALATALSLLLVVRRELFGVVQSRAEWRY
jgi:serine/threonine protein kinase